MELITKVHLHEVVAALVAVLLAITVAALALINRDAPDALTNAFFAAMAYVFGTRASTTIERLNGPRNNAPPVSPPAPAPPGG